MSQVAGQTSGRMTFPPAMRPTIVDIAWAAGIFEGEGTCYSTGVSGFNCVVQVNQKHRWILDKLRDLFGGTVYVDKWQTGEQFRYRVSGTYARGFLLTIYTFMSPHRKDRIRKTLRRDTLEAA